MTLLITYGVLAIAVSFLCSLLEACLLSVPRSYTEMMAQTGSRAGIALREMKDNIDRPLAAILTLNTIAHTVGAVGVGAQAAEIFGSAAVGVASAIMTVLILILSEIVPKTLGAVHAKTLAAPAALIIRLLIAISLPMIIPLEWINSHLGYQRRQESISRAELLSTLKMSKDSGVLAERELKVVENLVALSEIQLSRILTPRTVVFSLPEQMTAEKAWKEHYPFRFARVPVYSGNPEEVTGYVLRFAIHNAHYTDKGQVTLKELSKPIPVFPETAAADRTLENLIESRRHIALVVDEFGGMSGIVTLEDLLETLLGEEIVDETDTVADMQKLARRQARRKNPYS